MTNSTLKRIQSDFTAVIVDKIKIVVLDFERIDTVQKNQLEYITYFRITSYNVCYTKLLRKKNGIYKYGVKPINNMDLSKYKC